MFCNYVLVASGICTICIISNLVLLLINLDCSRVTIMVEVIILLVFRSLENSKVIAMFKTPNGK